MVIASMGRPVELARWAEYAAEQTHPPHQLILSVASAADLPSNFACSYAQIVTGPPGSSHQRNRGIDESDGADVIAFFDDDYVPSRHCLEGIARVFESAPDLGGVSGCLLADGATGPGLSFAQARTLLSAYDAIAIRPEPSLQPTRGLYGCNMAYRRSAIGDLRFDEAMPGYALYEDADFSRRVARTAPIARTDAFAGVHQGIRKGRVSGVRFGYSQLANAWWLGRKGVFTRGEMVAAMTRSLVVNHLKALRRHALVDYTGRAAGSRRALRDWVTGRLHPEAVLRL